MNFSNLALVISALFTLSFASWSQEERIPLADIRQPSNDLIFEGRVLTAEEAWRLQQDPVSPLDLSLLDPIESAVWKNEIHNILDPKLDEIPLNENDTFHFKGTITSNQGIMRFNVLPEKNSNRVFTILMEKTLHTTLLRRNLLRKLGYQIPAMKYLKKITVRFDSVAQRDHFIERELPEATYGAPSRWLGKDHRELGDEELTLTFHDVVAFMPSETDHYNTAMGVPPKRLTNRTLRSLLVPYALVNLGESVNKFPWVVGRIDNEYLVLPHFTFASMNTTMADAKWAMRRLATLERDDFQEVVRLSHFPKPVEKVLVEKLISRRNYLANLFPEEGFGELAFESEVNHGELLVDGQLTQEDWEGYASRFSHGEPDSPLKDFQYFIFSKIQNSAISNLLDYVNQELSLFEPSEKRLEFMQNQFEEGLEHFVDTGEFLEFGVGTWFSPILDGRLILSRDIVVGNYLGTDNLVQLADTVGVAINVGGILGVENIPQWPTASVSGNVSAVRTYTHLKPVKTLKATFKEPYKNMIVPLMKLQLKKRLNELAEVPNQDRGDVGDDDVDPRLEAIEELIKVINTQLGVGESILVTDRLTPRVMASGSFNMMETRFSLSAGTTGMVVRRLHLYRKDATTIQVYEDKGHGWSLSLSASIDHLIPVMKINGERTKGKYKVKMHTVDINSDLKENPKLFTNAKALHYLLEEGSSELLETQKKPYKVETAFLDKSVKFSLLVWRSKYLNGDADIAVTTPEGHRSEYVSLTSHSQSGINYQSFAYDVLNYYLKEWTKDLPITPQLDPERFRNPGQSIFGVSETQSAKFEARKSEEGLYSPFLSISSRREGWSASNKKLRRYIEKVNDHYGRDLFSGGSLDNATGLRLFDISVNTNVYEQGIERLKTLKESELRNISRRYARERRGECQSNSRRSRRIRTARTLIECGNLNNLISKNDECQRLRRRGGDTKKQAKCVLELAKDMNRDLEFNDFMDLVGEENIYVYGIINGFRKDSEILNEPIRSHSIGRIRGKFWNGPLDRLKEIMEIQNGEFHGMWIRETL